MKCTIVQTYLYEDDDITLITKLRAALHTAFCPVCAAEKRKLKTARLIMRNYCMPPAPDISASVMRALGITPEESADVETVSLRGWVIAGVFIVLSLTSAFFGVDFRAMAAVNGLSLLLPIGITMGCVITVYGAFFIGSHLDELDKKFSALLYGEVK